MDNDRYSILIYDRELRIKKYRPMFIDMYRKLGGREQLEYDDCRIYSQYWEVCFYDYNHCIIKTRWVFMEECIGHALSIEDRYN